MQYVQGIYFEFFSQNLHKNQENARIWQEMIRNLTTYVLFPHNFIYIYKAITVHKSLAITLSIIMR